MNKWADFDKLYKEGVKIEILAKPIIEEFFNEKLTHMITSRYCYYDFINPITKVKYEVKSFSCNYSNFTNIILPEEKINRIKLNDDLIFILVFKNYQQDSVDFSYYYIKYDPLIFAGFEIVETYIRARNHKHLNYSVPKKYISKIR